MSPKNNPEFDSMEEALEGIETLSTIQRARKEGRIVGSYMLVNLGYNPDDFTDAEDNHYTERKEPGYIPMGADLEAAE